MAGEPLPDFELVFDHAPGTGHDDNFEIVNSSAYRLRRSACFQKSNGALTCTTCHDPHGDKPKDYSAVCVQCHGPAIDSLIAEGRHPEGTDCVLCHLQKRRTEDVVHVVMTDHWIQRRLPPGNPLAELPERHGAAAEYSGEAVPYYPSPLPRTDENVLYQAIARGSPADLARELGRVRPRQQEFYIVLGQAWQRGGKLPDAIDAYEQAVRLKPNSSRALLGLAGAQRTAGRLALAGETLARARRIAPASAAAWFQSGGVDFDRGRTAVAMEKMEKAIALDPDFSAAHTGLAGILFNEGNSGPAENELRTALRIDPYDASAYDLIGRVLAGRGQTAESLFDFEKATRLRPGYAPHLYDYALALSAAGRSKEAQAAVEAALRADPEMPAAHALIGELLSRQGDIPGAIRHLKKAAAGSDPVTTKFALEDLRRLTQ
jgi:tetratricopeptide (TPR) repeat protein